MNKMIAIVILSMMSLCVVLAPIQAQSVKLSPKEQAQLVADMKEISPKFFQFQNRLSQILKEITTVVKDYHAGSLSRKEAAQRLLPLVKEQTEILNDKDFLAAQRIFTLLAQ